MVKGFHRPKDKTELEDRELEGFWKAIALSKKVGESGVKISLQTISLIHKTMFANAIPDMAGKFRVSGQDVKKLKCVEPPPGRLVQERMYKFWREFDVRLATIPRHPKKQALTQRKKWRGQIFDLAAWVQYQVAAIHPFVDGNGRMARLMTNLVLSRYGMPPSQVKYEGENKPRYLDALCQIDNFQDYEPLKHLIASGVYEAYLKEEKLRKRKQSG
ncbi:MAG: Fic family protein [Patescibacteria group bacterium]